MKLKFFSRYYFIGISEQKQLFVTERFLYLCDEIHRRAQKINARRNGSSADENWTTRQDYCIMSVEVF